MNWKEYVKDNKNTPLPRSFSKRVARTAMTLSYGVNKSKTLAGMV